jgi:hypothetical protein
MARITWDGCFYRALEIAAKHDAKQWPTKKTE